MDVNRGTTVPLGAQTSSDAPSHDLIGGPFAVIESDPGVFTALLRKLGVQGLEVTEIFDISDPFAGNSLNPRGLIFCYPCADEEEGSSAGSSQDAADDLDDSPDPDAECIWFAHQLSNDACASQAILNIALNLRTVRLRAELEEFKRDTEKMSPIMKGLAVTNCAFIREAHNSLARPADTRAALHAAARSTLAYSKKNGRTSKKPKLAQDETYEADQDAYHFIGYVPAHGKVWELNGLRYSGPLEVGEVPDAGGGWMDVVRPALRRRMQRLQANDHIRYNLLAVVEDQYERASDTLEMLKRERRQLERRLDAAHAGGWADAVDAGLLARSSRAFATAVRPSGVPGPTFGADFASRKLEVDMGILDMPVRKLPDVWATCVRKAEAARTAVEDELRAAERAHSDHISRTFDYDPFVRHFITAMHERGLLDPMLLRSGASGSTGQATSSSMDESGDSPTNGSRKKLKSKR